MAARQVVLIRHGESNAQVDGVVSGHDTCSGLSDRGRIQAAALRDRLSATGELRDVQIVYASVLERAIETAQIVLPALGVDKVRPECAWCELHPGEAEGLTWTAMRTRFPADGDPDDPSRRRLPGMETWVELYDRVGRRLQELAKEPDAGSVAIVGHGGTVAASLVALGGMDPRRGISLARATNNTSITEWAVAGGDWQLLRFNDAAHLGRL